MDDSATQQACQGYTSEDSPQTQSETGNATECDVGNRQARCTVELQPGGNSNRVAKGVI